jgi:hypothetical protein
MSRTEFLIQTPKGEPPLGSFLSSFIVRPPSDISNVRVRCQDDVNGFCDPGNLCGRVNLLEPSFPHCGLRWVDEYQETVLVLLICPQPIHMENGS